MAYLAPMQSQPFSLSAAHALHPRVPAGLRADLPRWRQLVSADWLAAWLGQRAVAAAPTGHWLLLEAGCEGQALFASGHIPGARFVDTQQLEQAPFWNVVGDAALFKVLQSHAIAPRSTVILYGRNMLAAARVAQLLLVAGVRDVRLLDGGLAAWCAAGHGLQQGGHGPLHSHEPPAAPSGPAPWPTAQAARPDYLLDCATTARLARSGAVTLVSIRSHAEWMGETSGYRYIEARGEIAGALWGHAGHDGDVNSMSSFQDATGLMKPAAAIEAQWAKAGIHREMPIAFYCGTGWRASLAFFYAWLMGWERISVFDGGWMEWSADAGNPVVCRAANMAAAAP